MEEKSDFYVEFSEVEKDTYILTSDKMVEESLRIALAQYDPENKMYSAVLSNTSAKPVITLDRLSELANGAQNDITKIKEINSAISNYVILDEAIGMVATAIWANVNTDIRLSYRNFGERKKKDNTLKRAKNLINEFNRQICVRDFIRSAIVTAWLEGNHISTIRSDGKNNWVLDQYPLGIAELAQYTQNGQPIVQINMEQLKNALQKTVLKNRRGNALYFENTAKEIEASFGKAIVDAYRAGDTYCRLDTDYTGVVRVNNFNKLYGVSPIMRALPSAIALDSLRAADISLADQKSKVIIHQKLRKELLDKVKDGKWFEHLSWAHNNLMRAFKQKTVVVSTPPYVEEISYVVKRNTEEISSSTMDSYTRKILSSLGVQFLSGLDDISAAVAKISYTVLLNTINAIGESVQRVLHNYYRTVLRENGIGDEYTPSVRILDTELLDAASKADLAKLLYGTFGASRETTFELLGYDLEEEASRRKRENKEGMDEIFYPYPLSYTTPGDSGEGGRPANEDSEDPDKQIEDKINRE